MDFLIEHRRKHKLNENQVLDLLNENLREQVIANLNGRVLKECEVFNNFDMIFVSEVTFALQRTLYVMSDTVFEEGEPGYKMFFIAKGTVLLIHRKSQTYIKQIGENSSFGQAAFFSGKPRCCSVQSNSFTEMLVLEKDDFEKILVNHSNDNRIYNEICEFINEEDDYSDIRIK